MFPGAQDPRHQTPVFLGYELARKPGRGGRGLEDEDEQPRREDYVAHRKGQPCAVCLVGKPGRCGGEGEAKGAGGGRRRAYSLNIDPSGKGIDHRPRRNPKYSIGHCRSARLRCPAPG